jgi:translation elongation factor EF-1beta
MVIFFTIFFLDNFVKEQKNKKIKDINKTKSELIAFGIERMQYHILVFL